MSENHVLDPQLLEILRCPKCKGEIEYQEEPPALLCQSCQLSYEVRDGIPILLIDEARPLNP